MKEEHKLLCQEILASVYAFKQGKRTLSTPFINLPPRSFTDYYRVISEPVALSDVKLKLDTGKGFSGYREPQNLFRDMQLVFLNACYFNEPSSQIHQDAQSLLSHFTSLYGSFVSSGRLPLATPIKSAEPVFLTVDEDQAGQGRSSGEMGGASATRSRLVTETEAVANGAQSKSKRSHAGATKPGKGRTAGLDDTGGQSDSPSAKGVGKGGSSPSAGAGKEKQKKRKRGEDDDGQEVEVRIATPPPSTTPNGLLHTLKPGTPGGVGRAGKADMDNDATKDKEPAKSKDLDEEEDDKNPKKPRAPPPPLIDPRTLPADYPIPQQSASDIATATEHALIRAEMDKTLPTWRGPAEFLPGDEIMGTVRGSGWWGDEKGGDDPVWAKRATEMLKVLKNYADIDGLVPMVTLNKMEERAPVPYLSFEHSLSLRLIEDRLKTKQFETMREFDKDMMKLFEKARRWWRHQGRKEYGHVLVLQRLYQALTCSGELESQKHVPYPSPVFFTSSIVPCGPGNCRPVGDSGKPNYEENQFTGFRVSMKDRVTIAEARYKGMTYKIGDFVHLMNPDDSSRPILGQVFRAWQPTGKAPSASHHVTVCWYYRPENTCHAPETMFFEEETFKTGHFVDHPVEDILERVGCQFYTRYTRVRPQEPEWYPGWPLYVCNSRYKEDVRNYAKIKNWSACIPEELRKTKFGVGVAAFDKGPHTLFLAPSPFLLDRNLSGKGITGGLTAPGSNTGDQENEDEVEDGPAAVAATLAAQKKERRKDRDRRKAAGVSDAGPSGSMGPPMQTPGPADMAMTAIGRQGLFDTPAGGSAGQSGFPGTPTPAGPSISHVPMQVDPIASTIRPPAVVPNPVPPQDPRATVFIPMMAGPVTPNPAGPFMPTPNNAAAPNLVRGISADAARPVRMTVPPPANQVSRPLAPPAPVVPEERIGGSTFASWIRGGEEVLRRDWDVQELPQSTVDLLETTAKGDKVLWFSGPPIDIPAVEQPKRSAAYLTYLAKAQASTSASADSSASGTMSGEDDGMDVDEADAGGGESPKFALDDFWGMGPTLRKLLGT